MPPPAQTADSLVGARRYRSGLLECVLPQVANSNDEAAFIQSQTAVSAGLLCKMTFACSTVNLFYMRLSPSIQQGLPLLATASHPCCRASWGQEKLLYLHNARLWLLVRWVTGSSFATGVRCVRN